MSQTVVVQQGHRRDGWLWLLAGLLTALTAGGGTYAIWEAQSVQDVPSIEVGHVIVDEPEVSGWFHDGIPPEVAAQHGLDG